LPVDKAQKLPVFGGKTHVFQNGKQAEQQEIARLLGNIRQLGNGFSEKDNAVLRGRSKSQCDNLNRWQRLSLGNVIAVG